MRKGLCSDGDAKILLELFELILDHDKLIDEVGFIHPSQFAELNEDSSVSRHPSVSILQTADEALRNSAAEFNSLLYDETVFWYSNHKLAISMQALPILYNAARLAYVDSKSGYKRSISLAKNMGSLNIASCGASCIQFPEIDVLKHSRALLILSPDFGSVWNSRKLVLSREHDLSLLMDEFNLSTLILSYSSKSEQAWSHRRWVIKKIAGKFHVLHDIIGKESELVKRIVEKSKMNYRAWNHCCWLISYMNKGQVGRRLICDATGSLFLVKIYCELDKSRKWAELHVADNCCFHYRRRLILNLLDRSKKEDEEGPLFNKCCSLALLKEELEWNVLIIKLYVGRESLWVHRRFLSYFWIMQITNHNGLVSPCRVHQEIVPSLDSFLGEELELIQTCLNIPSDEFDDVHAQSQHAATYMLWISKKILHCQESRFQEKLKEAGDLKIILIDTCPEKFPIWEGLLD